jgi:CRP-like cAMP-binding protein
MTRFSAGTAALRTLPPFSWFTETQLTWALPTLEQRRYPARTVLLRPGEKPDGLYTVLSGRVRVVHQDKAGHALVAASVGPHEFFGELGLFDGAECPAFVETVEPTELVYIPRNVVLECLEDNGRAGLHMLRTIVSRLCALHRKLGAVALTKVSERVAAVLLEHGADCGGEWHVNVGSEQIAAMVGSSREMVSRVIKDFIARDLVRRDKRKLIVKDRGAFAGLTAGNAAAQ